MDDSEAAGVADGALLASVDVVSLVVVVSDEEEVADVSAAFWQAPSPKARPAARITARAVR